MLRKLLTAALLVLAPVGCKSVEVAVDYPGMHVAAKFEAHDRPSRLAADAPPAEKKSAKPAKHGGAVASDSRPSITVTL